MTIAAQVTWAEMSNSSEATLLKLGGVMKRFFGKSYWQLKPDDAISMIEQDEWRFYIEIDDEKVWLEIEETVDGRKHLGLSGDSVPEEIFESLPDNPNQ